MGTRQTLPQQLRRAWGRRATPPKPPQPTPQEVCRASQWAAMWPEAPFVLFIYQQTDHRVLPVMLRFGELVREDRRHRHGYSAQKRTPPRDHRDQEGRPSRCQTPRHDTPSVPDPEPETQVGQDQQGLRLARLDVSQNFLENVCCETWRTSMLAPLRSQRTLKVRHPRTGRVQPPGVGHNIPGTGWCSRAHSWKPVWAVTGEEEDRLLPGVIRRGCGRGGGSGHSMGPGHSVLQLRHLVQVRGQHLGSFYVVVPVELFILGVGAVISGSHRQQHDILACGLLKSQSHRNTATFPG